MLLVRRAALSSKDVAVQFLVKPSNGNKCPLSYQVLSERSDSLDLQRNNSLIHFQRQLHVTSVNRDLETGLRALGAGVAATGVIGSGIGLGIIFGNLVSAIARNPSVANKVFTNAIMGAAFCESLGLFAMVIAFIVMP